MESLNILRLKTGEDIICYMEYLSTDEVILRDPMSIIFQTNPKTGNDAIILENWLPVQLIKENEVTIKTSEILAVLSGTMEFNTFYQSAITLQKYSDVKDDNSEDDVESLTQDEMKMILELTPNGGLMH